MHIHKSGPNYLKWCEQSGVDPNGMEMNLSEAIFGSLLDMGKIASQGPEVAAPEPVQAPAVEKASESKPDAKKGK